MNNILKASAIFVAGMLSSSIAGFIYGWAGYGFDLFLVFPFIVAAFVISMSMYAAKALLYDDKKVLFVMGIVFGVIAYSMHIYGGYLAFEGTVRQRILQIPQNKNISQAELGIFTNKAISEILQRSVGITGPIGWLIFRSKARITPFYDSNSNQGHCIYTTRAFYYLTLSLLTVFPGPFVNYRKLYIIGLTGNIACGKSTVLDMLRERGAQVLDADRVTHELQAPGRPVYHAIVAAFGPGILSAPDGPIDRRALGAIVFADPAALRRLEQIVHPAVRERIMSWLGSVRPETGDWRLEREDQSQASSLQPPASQVAVIDAIKLLEGGWKQICDAIWVVTCTPEQQLARLISTRGMREDEARARIAAQPPQADKVAQADVVIDNSGPLEATCRQVEAAWQAMLR